MNRRRLAIALLAGACFSLTASAQPQSPTADAFAPSVRDQLHRAKGAINLQALDDRTQQVKAGWRADLAQHPDPAHALQLALLIQDQLWGTELQFSANNDFWPGASWAREDEGESYETLGEVLEAGLRCAERGSELHRTFAIALAKINLLRGRWTEMNQALESVGERGIAAADVPFLCAPPTDWTKLGESWGKCDPSMRSGEREIVFSFTKDGRPLAGAHVLLKRQPPETNFRSTGWHTDTLFWAPRPVPAFHEESFGYRGDDRNMTRYAVSDACGEVRFEGLPEIPLVVEILVPTASFTERGSKWHLARVAADGTTKLLEIGRLPLEARDLEHGSRLRFDVLPDLRFQLTELQPIEPASFTLRWTGADHARRLGATSFELTLALSCPDSRCFDPSLAPVLAEVKRAVDGDSWSPSEEDRARLVPGNLYFVSLAAKDRAGTLVAKWDRTRFFVPRAGATRPPSRFGGDLKTVAPIQPRNWWQATFKYPDGTQEDLRQNVSRFLLENPDAFEIDYVRVLSAWLDWHDGRREQAQEQLVQIMQLLPQGNVARATAAALLADLDAGKAAEKALSWRPPNSSGN
jgi:hypothetical protein